MTPTGMNSIMTTNQKATYRQTFNISRTLVGKKCWSFRCSSSNYTFILDTWLQWVGQSQLQDETRNVYVLGFGAAYIRGLVVRVCVFHKICCNSPKTQFLSCQPTYCETSWFPLWLTMRIRHYQNTPHLTCNKHTEIISSAYMFNYFWLTYPNITKIPTIILSTSPGTSSQASHDHSFVVCTCDWCFTLFMFEMPTSFLFSYKIS